MPPLMRIMAPSEAVPILLDSKASPIIALDTEFEGDAGGPSKAALHGVSLAGGTPETGLVGCFYPFGQGIEVAPWTVLRDRVLLPIFGDATRTVVQHPLKVDMQVLRARGVGTRERTRCVLEDTMQMAHTYDENLPKGLKDLAECILGVPDTASYAETQRELKKIKKDGERAVKDALRAAWEVYRDGYKSVKAAAPGVDFDAVPWVRAVTQLPPKLKKADVEAHVLQMVRASVMAPYENRIRQRFEEYASKDALYTLALRYFFMKEIPAAHREFLELETRISHPVVTGMEEAGLKIDVTLLTAIKVAMEGVLTELRADVIRRWGVDASAVAPMTYTDDTSDRAPDEPGVIVLDFEDPDEPEGRAVFNPASTDQVCRILWDQWQLRPPPWAMAGGELKPKFRRNKDGYCKVDDAVLSYLADKKDNPHAEDIRKLLDLRAYEKVYGTYVAPMLERALADPEHRIHASFWSTGARTGRFTSDDPNMQNIPRPHTMPEVPIPPGADVTKPPMGVIVDKERDKVTGKDRVMWRIDSLRKCFITDPDWLMVSADLSQIENRIMAHESQDPKLLWLYRTWDCFNCKGTGETNKPLHTCPKCGAPEGKRDKDKPDQPITKGFMLGRDIHAATSVAVGYFERYGPKEGRQRAKTTNHAATYGMSPQTMARRDGIPLKEAEAALAAWHNTYVRVKGVHGRVQQDIRTKGFITMYDGHIRRFLVQRLLLSTNNFRSWEWEGIIREGVNCLAQGGTGIIVKRAMVIIEHEFATNPMFRGLARIVSQIHDEILCEAHKSVAKEALAFVCRTLENVVELTVPVIAEGGTGVCWSDAHA
jgi:DNA polymerase I-like protein with 3'-5' exonuclease and polymerase domains